MSDRSNSQDAVPVSDPDDSPLSLVNSVGVKDADLHGGFTPKEAQTSVFGAAVQIYNSRPNEDNYESKIRAVEDAATIFAVVTNEEICRGIFAKIAAEHNHPYDVFAKAKADFGPEAK
ncbi:hypothetical protein [Microvirga arabica]|uniref:hypothetical protein n=1 Tax=Microvirga arabica TaxID=1128671 RepID=UPI0019396ACA|nr:hypothetical protein [Microvirga arabica]MBM1175219.1 hypothetical protein [Microvirga arabica]